MTIRPSRVLLHTCIVLTVIFAPIAFDLGPRVQTQVPAARATTGAQAR